MSQITNVNVRPNLWSSVKKTASRIQDWFVVQSAFVKAALVIVAVLIPASGIYSAVLMHKQAVIADQVKAMAKAGDVWKLNDALPVVFGPGSVLNFVETRPVERISVIYEPLMWDVSERIVLIESQGKQHAFYPSDMETRIFTEKAVTAPWGGKLVFIPRSELSPRSLELFQRLDQRFAEARPQAEKDGWKAGVSGVVSVALSLGLMGFLFFQMRGQFKSLKFIEPGQIKGSIDDLVGMDDIKGEVAQIVDQYLRRAEYAEYGINKPFNVMFSGPAGTGKTKLASYLAKELKLPILFHSAANLETGFVAGGSNTLTRIVAMAKRRRQCIVFLDEAQDLFAKRGGRRKYDDDTANTLLSLLDGVRSRGDAEIIWIVASNFNSETMQMDEAMLRRFQMKVDFRLPNKEERLAIVHHYLDQRADKVLADLDLRHLVDVTEGRSPADIETIVNQAGISAVQTGELIGADTLMQAAERVLVGNVNTNTTAERERDRRIIATHEWGHFLMDLDHERRRTGDNWEKILADMKTIKISLKANPRTNALGFVFHKQGSNLLMTKGDIEHEVRVLLGGMANEELFFGEDGTTNGAHNDITRVTKLLHHAVGEMGMYRKTRLNFGALKEGNHKDLDEETRNIMEAQSERLYGETKAVLARLMPLTEYLVSELLAADEMSLGEALEAIRRFESVAAELAA
ncbi:ATP-dependent zinc metalloprotease FtsH [Novimethylophilus kurashikiensis]|uniref:ATP-dependent zinc metalloprotease FtsH n=1 Tax=Novimethylophilus kurashikiensis TaxID=1825523 RepID=A0A2R5F5I7_9PROT|nr:AAA family ATPase [Novimethylophilus kurashikiensis]GBG13610.1 ATP-dependent zinc metalloprotease FtsH [Novimethylophilus kurashikiensis]